MLFLWMAVAFAFSFCYLCTQDCTDFALPALLLGVLLWVHLVVILLG
jgi:hypothetical protein